MNKCCVVIISHKEKLEGNDEKSFLRALKIFGKNRHIKVLIPDNINSNYYEKYKDTVKIIRVKNKWLSSSKEYNAMCCNKEFWNLFDYYEYVLIYQTDCWIYEDRVDEFINMGFDWYGAPWPHHNDTVGNGGFSLRKVSKMIEITTKYEFKWDSLWGAEDTWFCQNHKDELNICDLNTACNFSIESITKKYFAMAKTYPMGVHSKCMMKFWDENGDKIKQFKKDIL